ncbi:hypothetical protein ACRAWF_44895 [Streptomyces sp. L7]
MRDRLRLADGRTARPWFDDRPHGHGPPARPPSRARSSARQRRRLP